MRWRPKFRSVDVNRVWP